MNSVAKKIVIFLAQGAYSGKSPFAPGTAGTAVGVLLYLLWVRHLTPAAYALVCVVLALIGTWIADQAEAFLGGKDHPTIVIDEIAGYLVSLFLLPPGWGYVVAGFFLFRLFDIIKPWPLRRLQDLHGGPGVMLDDIGAGIYTNLALQLARILL